MAFANNLDPDEAAQNVGPLQRSKLFDTQSHIIYPISRLQILKPKLLLIM